MNNLIVMLRELDLEKNDKKTIREVLNYVADELVKENQKQKEYIKYLEEKTPIASKKIYGDNREELQQRIDNAIKYIIDFNNSNQPTEFVDLYELLDILRGDSDE